MRSPSTWLWDVFNCCDEGKKLNFLVVPIALKNTRVSSQLLTYLCISYNNFDNNNIKLSFGFWSPVCEINIGVSLTYFSLMFYFYTPWKCQKTIGFLTFSRVLLNPPTYRPPTNRPPTTYPPNHPPTDAAIMFKRLENSHSLYRT